MDDEPKMDRLKISKKKIRMQSVQGGKTDAKLMDCYFYPVDEEPGIYLLCNEFDVTLAVVTSGQPFMFEHDGLIWKVPNPAPLSENFSIDNVIATGSWQNNYVDKTGEDGGTFIAQGSGGADGDADASYAAAK